MLLIKMYKKPSRKRVKPLTKALITAAVIGISAGVTCAGVFGSAAVYAKNNSITRDKAVAIAGEFVENELKFDRRYYTGDVDHELKIRGNNLTDSYYILEVDFEKGSEKYTICIDGRTEKIVQIKNRWDN